MNLSNQPPVSPNPIRNTRHGSTRWHLVFIALVGLFGHVRADEELVLPLRLHLTQGATLAVRGLNLEVWVTPDEVKTIVLPEVNRIWKQADIRFEIERIAEEPIPESPNRARLLQQIADFKRADADQAHGSPFELTRSLFNPLEVHPAAINVYFFPYVGETLQGVAALGGNRVLLGVWTNKFSHGQEPPKKTLLTEPEPMNIGSLSRTLSHELGHSLTLTHPAKTDLPKGRLMGGAKQGYLLTPEEIAKARESAKKHLEALASPHAKSNRKPKGEAPAPHEG